MGEDQPTSSFPSEQHNVETVRAGADSGIRSMVNQPIGPYKLRSVLGEGGFGVVYLAEQLEPVRRRVALKVIKPGMDSKAVLARFEAERQALAVMDHPCVARVYDGSTTQEGRPYFVMEYVRGLPITEHCDRHRLGLRERIELFIQVCGAVQHAHMKGVIHRDIKPSNILVEYEDADGRGTAIPKVIDFGVAKALSQPLTDRTIYTEQGQIIGTPEYMSPEQAEMSGQDIDTRSDVYSLGVLLYEVLTGSLPFDRETLRAGGMAEVQRIIREVDPPKPSTRLSSSTARHGQQDDDFIEQVARQRHTDYRALMRSLRGDLDWIVMKCLEKDRSRRYDTANALAMDLQRYLRNEPVIAGPPGTMYRLRKFVRRNRGPVAAVTIVMVVLLAAVTGVSLALAEAHKQRELADHERESAITAKEAEADQRRIAQQNAERALAAEAEAEQRAEILEQVVEFQARQLSDLDAELMGARLRRDIIGMRRSFLQTAGLEGGDDSAAVQRSLQDLERSLLGVNFTDLARRSMEQNIFDRALDTMDEQFAHQPLVKARLLQTVADTLRALGLYERASRPQMEAVSLRRSELGEEHADTLRSITNLGMLLQVQGKLDEAEVHLRRVLETYRSALGDEHVDTLSAIGNLGGVLVNRGKLDEAEAFYQEVLTARRRLLGNDHSETLSSINNMGVLLQAKGRLAESEPYFREALAGRRKVHGDDHPRTMVSINNMGFILQAQDKLAEAVPYYREAIDRYTRVLGEQHPSTLIAMSNMGRLLRQLGEFDEAERLGAEAVSRARNALPPGHWHTAVFLSNHGQTLASMQRFEQAEACLHEAYAIFVAALGSGHERTQGVMQHCADLYRVWNEFDPAAGHDATLADWERRLAQVERRSDD